MPPTDPRHSSDPDSPISPGKRVTFSFPDGLSEEDVLARAVYLDTHRRVLSVAKNVIKHISRFNNDPQKVTVHVAALTEAAKAAEAAAKDAKAAEAAAEDAKAAEAAAEDAKAAEAAAEDAKAVKAARKAQKAAEDAVQAQAFILDLKKTEVQVAAFAAAAAVALDEAETKAMEAESFLSNGEDARLTPKLKAQASQRKSTEAQYLAHAAISLYKACARAPSRDKILAKKIFDFCRLTCCYARKATKSSESVAHFLLV